MTNIVLVIIFFRAARLAGARRRAVRTNFGLIARRTAVRLQFRPCKCAPIAAAIKP